MENIRYRIRFSKLGVIKYISHLDMTRVFMRALVRAEIPLKFSEGFTPHAKIAFGLPLSVGTEGLAEVCDLTLADGFCISPEELMSRLSKQLPDGITLLSCGEQTEKLNDIAASEYLIEFPYLPDSNIGRIEEVLSGRLSVMMKKKKGEEVETDITDKVFGKKVRSKDGHVILEVTLPSGNNGSLNPKYVIEAIRNSEGFDDCDFEVAITRKTLLLADFRPF